MPTHANGASIITIKHAEMFLFLWYTYTKLIYYLRITFVRLSTYLIYHHMKVENYAYERRWKINLTRFRHPSTSREVKWKWHQQRSSCPNPTISCLIGRFQPGAARITCPGAHRAFSSIRFGTTPITSLESQGNCAPIISNTELTA